MKKPRTLCAVMAALVLLSGSKLAAVTANTFVVPTTVYAASGSTTTTKSATAAKSTSTATSTKSTSTTTSAKSTSTATSTKSTSTTTSAKSTSATTSTKSTSTTTSAKTTSTSSSTKTTASATAKIKVGEKTWKTQMQVKEFSRSGKRIYGEIYRPVGDGPFPGIIICHGLNGTCGYAREFAKEIAAQGVVAYIFDFIGGSDYGKSGGSTTEMSVLTEASDFNVVFNGIRSLSYVDESRMFVMGESQGGFVATYIAGTRPNDVKGLIAMCPAYNIQDLNNSTVKYILYSPWCPSKINLYGATLGRKYFTDLMTVDIYKTMANYKGKAVIIHGSADNTVPISYSQKAVKTMPNAKLITVNGGGHAFGINGTVRNAAISLIKEVANK